MAYRRKLFTDEMLKEIDRDSVINGDDSDSESSLLDISRQTCSQDGSVNTLGFLQRTSIISPTCWIKSVRITGSVFFTNFTWNESNQLICRKHLFGKLFVISDTINEFNLKMWADTFLLKTIVTSLFFSEPLQLIERMYMVLPQALLEFISTMQIFKS